MREMTAEEYRSFLLDRRISGERRLRGAKAGLHVRDIHILE
jgi:hypothetical protein